MIKTVMANKPRAKPVKIWTDDIDAASADQLEQIAQMPFIHKHVAAMADVHLGIGATIGSVIATRGAIIPAAVGVDIGCGMLAVKTTLRAVDLPDNLKSLRSDIESVVPHGGSAAGCHQLNHMTCFAAASWGNLVKRYDSIIDKHPGAKAGNTFNQIGTLGGGNHFIEICLDETDAVWVMLHSGSRGVGNKIGTYFIAKAKREMEKYHIETYLPHKDLSYFAEHTEIFDDYCSAVNWAQNYAAANREVMMQATLESLSRHTYGFSVIDEAINCHHNYIAKENHFGANVIITRKGAIRAREGDLGIIPGSMGDKSYIVRGLGEKESFCSCSHGAGRKMSRTAARKLFTVADLQKQTEGVECPKDEARVDEIPAAYKRIDDVMANQTDLVEVVHTLKQVVNIKG